MQMNVAPVSADLLLKLAITAAAAYAAWTLYQSIKNSAGDAAAAVGDYVFEKWDSLGTTAGNVVDYINPLNPTGAVQTSIQQQQSFNASLLDRLNAKVNKTNTGGATGSW